MNTTRPSRPKGKDSRNEARSFKKEGRASASSAKRPPQRKNAQPIGLPVRKAALQLLEAVLRQGLPLEQVIGRITQGLKQNADRALVHALAAAVLRWCHDLDQLIDSATAKPLAPDVKARMVLRMALAQKLVLKQPAHVAIATVLPWWMEALAVWFMAFMAALIDGKAWLCRNIRLCRMKPPIVGKKPGVSQCWLPPVGLWQNSRRLI